MTADEVLQQMQSNLTNESQELVIDAETRTINIPASETLFGVKGDKNIERKYFRCPKIVGDNVDLSTHLIYIAYVYTEKNTGSIFPNIGIQPYYCDDVAVDGDDITFSWKLSENVFQSAGFIVFKMYAKEKEDSPYTVFNTAPAIGTVLYTIGDGVESIVSENPDIINQLLAKMESVQEIATPEAMQNYVNTYLEENPPSGVEIDSTLTQEGKAADAKATGEQVRNIDETINGKKIELPGVIDDPDYILSGSPILLSPENNKLSLELTFTKNGTNGDYDPHTGKVTSIGNSIFGTWLHVPLERVKKYYFHAIASNGAVMKINLYGSNNDSSTGGTRIKQIGSGDSIDMTEYDEYQYYNIAILVVTPNPKVPFSLVAYFGETQNNNLVLSNDNLSAKDYVGFIMLNSDNASAKSGGLESSITKNMPSKKSVLLTNKDSEIAKYEKPFSFRNTYTYLNNGENKYFCWNNNMLHYDKNIHKYVYICKNKSTHTSSGDNNEYMYLIDPVDPLSAEPQKIYTKEGKQITWCQGFIIKEDGTWILADCTVSDYNTPKMIRSTDHGKTFEIIGDFNPPTSGAYFNSINLGFNGRIFGSYDDGTISTTKHDSMISYSDDDGLTWIDLHISGQKFVEQLILPISDNRLALIGRYNAYGSTEQKAVTAYSDDNGITWNFFSSDMKMHANDCAGFMHDGFIELFCLERYYNNSFRVGDMQGQLTHYIGSADDFVNNKMIEQEVFYLTGYESADLGHPSACMDEYGGAMIITSANAKREQNNTYPLVMWSDCNKNPMN